MKEVPGSVLRLKDPSKIEEVLCVSDIAPKIYHVIKKEVFEQNPIDFRVVYNFKGNKYITYDIDEICPEELPILSCAYINPDLENFEFVGHTKVIKEWKLFPKVCLMFLLADHYKSRLSGVSGFVPKRFQRIELSFLSLTSLKTMERSINHKNIDTFIKRLLYMLNTRMMVGNIQGLPLAPKLMKDAPESQNKEGVFYNISAANKFWYVDTSTTSSTWR